MTVTQQAIAESYDLVKQALSNSAVKRPSMLYYTLKDLEQNLRNLKEDFVDLPY